MFKVISRANKYIDETAPWVLAKDESKRARLATVLYNLLETLRITVTLLLPFMPDSCAKAFAQIGAAAEQTTWDNAAVWGVLPADVTVHKGETLFPRIDMAKELAELEALKAAKEVAAVKPDAARIALLRAALGSVADRAIIPMPDWLGLGAEAHLNTPGKLGGNWTWRAAEGFDAEPLASRIQAECEVYCRAKEPVEKEAKTSI